MQLEEINSFLESSKIKLIEQNLFNEFDEHINVNANTIISNIQNPNNTNNETIILTFDDLVAMYRNNQIDFDTYVKIYIENREHFQNDINSKILYNTINNTEKEISNDRVLHKEQSGQQRRNGVSDSGNNEYNVSDSRRDLQRNMEGERGQQWILDEEISLSDDAESNNDRRRSTIRQLDDRGDSEGNNQREDDGFEYSNASSITGGAELQQGRYNRDIDGRIWGGRNTRSNERWNESGTIEQLQEKRDRNLERGYVGKQNDDIQFSQEMFRGGERTRVTGENRREDKGYRDEYEKRSEPRGTGYNNRESNRRDDGGMEGGGYQGYGTSSKILSNEKKLIDFQNQNEVVIGSLKDRFNKNYEAITLLKQIETENRQATLDEQHILNNFSGWGGIPQVFDIDNKEWIKEYNDLQILLTDDEYIRAKNSTLDAFYTPKIIIDNIYKALDRFGFNTNDEKNIFEPSAGIGTFLSYHKQYANNYKFACTELDSISARILKQLYPNQEINNIKFENYYMEINYDAFIGNPPFGQKKLEILIILIFQILVFIIIL